MDYYIRCRRYNHNTNKPYKPVHRIEWQLIYSEMDNKQRNLYINR